MSYNRVAEISGLQIRHRTPAPGDRPNGCLRGPAGRSVITRAMVSRHRQPAIAASGAETVVVARVSERRVERRRYPRRRGQCTVSLLPSPAGGHMISNREWAFRASRMRGTMLDLSIGGVAFALNAPLEAGTVLDLELRHPQRIVSVIRRIEVIENLPHHGDQWKILCRFTQPLSFEEVVQLSLSPNA